MEPVISESYLEQSNELCHKIKTQKIFEYENGVWLLKVSLLTDILSVITKNNNYLHGAKNK